MGDVPKFIRFIHLQKCAGTTIGELIKKQRPTSKIHTHTTIPLKNKTTNQIIVGNIRHPFDVYVSLWSYGCKKEGVFYRKIKKYYPKLLYLYKDSSNVQNFRKWLDIILNYKIDLPPRQQYQDFKTMKRYNIGLLTYRFFSLYNENNFDLLKYPHKNPLVDKFIKVESIAKDLRALGVKYKHLIINVSKHLKTSKYYTKELKKLVYQKDRYIFKKFGYKIR